MLACGFDLLFRFNLCCERNFWPIAVCKHARSHWRDTAQMINTCSRYRESEVKSKKKPMDVQNYTDLWFWLYGGEKLFLFCSPIPLDFIRWDDQFSARTWKKLESVSFVKLENWMRYRRPSHTWFQWHPRPSFEPSEWHNHFAKKCQRKKKTLLVNLPQCLGLWVSCDLRASFCHLFVFSNSNRRDDSELFCGNTVTLNHFLAWMGERKSKCIIKN